MVKSSTHFASSLFNFLANAVHVNSTVKIVSASSKSTTSKSPKRILRALITPAPVSEWWGLFISFDFEPFYCRFVSVIFNSPKALRRQWIHTISRTTSSTDSTKTKVNQFDLLWVYILLRMQTTLRTGPTQMLPQHCWAPVTVRA